MSSSSALVVAAVRLAVNSSVSLPWLRIDSRIASRARIEFSHIDQPLGQLSQLRIIEAARHFLPVARDKGHRRPLIQKLDGSSGLCRLGADLHRDECGDALNVRRY